jgi:putative MATE family efflux protein
MMLGSATQQIIVLSDNIFLYHTSLKDFGAIALVGVFYLMIASIGFGFSRGGQILIARYHGKNNSHQIKQNFYTLLGFQFLLALVFFLLLQFFADDFFYYFIKSPEYYSRILDYIYPRSYGIFFSYIGFAIIALYTGMASTRFIVIDTIILAVVNIALNYVLILGKFGFEPMGIKGAAIASTCAEIVAFVCFLVYMIFDKSLKELSLLKNIQFRYEIIKKMYKLSSPIVLQSILGLGSWFIFFSLIEQKMGKQPLEVSNLVRNIYLILSIPSWGFAAGVNTLVSNMIGQQRPADAISIINKTVWICFFLTMFIALPICLFPEFFLYPLYGGSNPELIVQSLGTFKILLIIMSIFSVSTIYMNGVVGTGATPQALKIQFYATAVYLIYTWFAINNNLAIEYIWLSEVFYWIIVMGFTFYFIYSRQWIRTQI